MSYTYENLYNDFLILQDFFPPRKLWVFLRFLSGIWYYLHVVTIHLSSSWGAMTLSTRTPNSFDRINFWYVK